jgi:hypothetical protein
MANLKNKIQVFLLGLMLGLLVGGGFFILKLDDYFKELRFYKKLTERSIRHENDEEQVKIKTKEGKQNISTENNYSLNHEKVGDTTSISLPADSSRNVHDKDSTGMHSENSEEILVKKDEIITFKNVEVINLGQNFRAAKDSLLQQVSGIKEDNKNIFRVEFWQSPINYKGYKMTHNKLILYGVNSTDPFSVFQVDGEIYLKHISNVYHLNFGNDFTPFEKVSDPALIAKLNK